MTRSQRNYRFQDAHLGSASNPSDIGCPGVSRLGLTVALAITTHFIFWLLHQVSQEFGVFLGGGLVLSRHGWLDATTNVLLNLVTVEQLSIILLTEALFGSVLTL